MATALDAIVETRSHLEGGSRGERNRLDLAMDASQTTATLEFSMGGIRRGAVISVDLELMYCWSVAGQVVTVQRGYLGSTATIHADASIVEVNPVWSDYQILRALNGELAAYSSPIHGLYRVRTVDLVFSAARAGYDLTGATDIIDVIDVNAVGIVAGDRHRLSRFRIIRNQDTADFASGSALYLYDDAYTGRPIRVAYKAPFTALPTNTTATDLATTGLLATAYDIPPLGAAARLVAPREVARSRTDVQPEPRRAEDVPPGTSRQAAGGLLALRNQRLVEESARLASYYPSLARVS